MNRTFCTRALPLACLLAASGAAYGAFDELSSAPAAVQTQTWYFPDGSNHTVLQASRPDVAGAPDTRVLGAGPASMPAAALPDDAGADEASNVITQTWYFPDGSNHTVITAAASPTSAPDTTTLGAGASSLATGLASTPFAEIP